MKTSSFKIYFATILFTVTLASFTFAGDIQCPIAPPPPRGDGGDRTVIADVNDVYIKYIKDFLGHWIKF